MEVLNQYKKFILLGLAVVAFLLIAFAPAVDILGKATYSGFKYVFDANGAGFSRVLMLLCILAPLAAGYFSFLVPAEKQGNTPMVCFLAGVVLLLITSVCLPEGCAFAWGAWVSLVLNALGIFVCVAAKAPAQK